MSHPELEEFLSEHLGFRLATNKNGILLFDDPIDFDKVSVNPLNLLAIGNTKLLYAVSNTTSISIGNLADLNDQETARLKLKSVVFGPTTCLAFDKSNQYLYVVSNSNVHRGLVSDILAGNSTPFTPVTTAGNVSIVHMSPLQSDLYFYLRTDKTLTIVNGDSQTTIGNINSACWDISGLKIGAVSNNTLHIYDKTGDAKLTHSIDSAGELTGVSCIDSSNWMVVSSPDDEDQLHFLVSLGSSETVSAIPLAPPFGEATRAEILYSSSLINWSEGTSFSFFTSALSTEINTIECGTNVRLVTQLNETDRAELPMDDDSGEDTLPVGFAVDISATELTVKEPCAAVQEATGVLPRLLCLNSLGNLLIWYVFESTGLQNGSLSLQRAFDAIVPKDVLENPSSTPATKETPSSGFGTSGLATSEKPASTSGFGSTGFGSTGFGSGGSDLTSASGFGSTGFGSKSSDGPAFGQSSFGQPLFGSATPFGSGAPKPTTSTATSNFAKFGTASASFASAKSTDSPFGSMKASNESPFGSLPSGKDSPFGSVAPNKDSPFGSTKSTESPFGSVAPKKDSPFGSATPKGSIFGASKPSNETPSSGGLFGSTKPSTESSSGGLFGSTKQSTDSSSGTGGVFGSTNPLSGGVFESKESDKSSSGGLFGSTKLSTKPLFEGKSDGPLSEPSSQSLFGSKPSTDSACDTLFGTKASTESSTGGLFGPKTSDEPPNESSNETGKPSVGLFGSTKPSTGLFEPTKSSTGGLFGSEPISGPVSSGEPSSPPLDKLNLSTSKSNAKISKDSTFESSQPKDSLFGFTTGNSSAKTESEQPVDNPTFSLGSQVKAEPSPFGKLNKTEPEEAPKAPEVKPSEARAPESVPQLVAEALDTKETKQTIPLSKDQAPKSLKSVEKDEVRVPRIDFEPLLRFGGWTAEPPKLENDVSSKMAELLEHSRGNMVVLEQNAASIDRLVNCCSFSEVSLTADDVQNPGQWTLGVVNTVIKLAREQSTVVEKDLGAAKEQDQALSHLLGLVEKSENMRQELLQVVSQVSLFKQLLSSEKMLNRPLDLKEQTMCYKLRRKLAKIQKNFDATMEQMMPLAMNQQVNHEVVAKLSRAVYEVHSRVKQYSDDIDVMKTQLADILEPAERNQHVYVTDFRTQKWNVAARFSNPQ